MKTLNIIGCGNVGKTLGYLWNKEGSFKIQDIVNRSIESSEKAVDFLHSGNAVKSIDRMRPADVFLIGASDNNIASCAKMLTNTGILQKGNLVFHCSGAISSKELEETKKCGSIVGSIHPVKSFADPQSSVETFQGTYCGVEGDSEATSILSKAFESIGAKLFEIDPEQKTYYHAATVIVCNYLTALIEFGVQNYIKSGLDREKAIKIMEPIVRGTVDNIFKLDTVRALTGPIARGDYKVVEKQLVALKSWNKEYGELYRLLGSVALNLSRDQGTASRESIAVLSQLLR